MLKKTKKGVFFWGVPLKKKGPMNEKEKGGDLTTDRANNALIQMPQNASRAAKKVLRSWVLATSLSKGGKAPGSGKRKWWTLAVLLVGGRQPVKRQFGQESWDRGLRKRSGASQRKGTKMQSCGEAKGKSLSNSKKKKKDASSKISRERNQTAPMAGQKKKKKTERRSEPTRGM